MALPMRASWAKIEAIYVLLLVSTFLGVLNAQTYYSTEAPLLLATPDNITVSAGTRLTLVCVAWGNPSPNITWTPDPTQLPYQNVYTTSIILNTLTYVVSILEICYTEPQFSGNYSCLASNGVAATSLGGNIASFQLQVNSQPSCASSYTVSSNLQYVYVNEEVSCIGCSLPGAVPAYSWTINNSSAIGQAGAYILFNGSLLIQDPLALLLGATGVLTVQCYDQTQLLSYVAYVALSEPPVVVAGSQDIITTTNLKLSAVCVAWGKPLPTITWTSTYVNLTSYNLYTTVVSVAQYSYVVSFLEICPTLSITSDMYTCTASSTAGGASLGLTSSSFLLQVPITPPSIQVVEKSTLQVSCSLVGNASVTITSVSWVDPLGRVVSNSSTLQVLSILRSQSGVYTCIIQTASSNTISSTTVIVLYPPSISVIGAQTIYIPQGLSLTLNCSFVGLPTPNITWTSPSGLTIQSSSHLMVQSSSNFTQLTINSLNGSDTGNYTCTATNYLGPSSLATAVYVQGPPNSPNVVVANTNTTAISLNWSSGFTGNSPLVNVSISYQSLNYILEGTMYLTLPAVYSATLSGLHPNANYSIQIALVNAAGFTSSPTTAIASTLPITLNVTRNFQVQENGAVQLSCAVIGDISSLMSSIEWLDPQGRVASIGSFLTIPSIQRTQSGVYTCTLQSQLYNTTSSTTITVFYPPSVSVIGAQTIYVPQGLSLTLNCSFVGLPTPNITWTGPSGLTIQSSSHLMVQSSGNFTRLTINSLNGSDTGNYTCTAANYLGPSSLATAVYVQVPPDPPSNVVITNTDTYTISLSWSSGFTGYSPLVNVSISYESPNYLGLEGTMYLTLPVVYSATLSGLHPNANYSIHVALVNAAGFTSSFTTTMTSTPSFSEAPLLLGNPGDTSVQGGTRLSLVCVAWGNPLPNITWSTNPLGVPYQNIYTTIISLNSLAYQVSILEICYALPEFSGTYSCSSSNGVVSSPLGGNTASFQLQVTVPSCSGSYNITSNLQSFFTPEEVVCFTCSLPGGVPVRSWTINGTSAVGLPGVTVLYNGTLLVADPLGLLLSTKNSLPIQCFDQTQSVTYTAYLKFNATPDPPTNVTVTNRSPISISLTWSTGFNGYAPLVYVNITYESPNYLQEGTQYLIVPPLSTATLSGLHPNANYSIHVALVNAAGFTSSFATIQTSTLSIGLVVPQSIQLQENSNLQLLCIVAGNTSGINASIQWLDPQGSVVSNNGSLLVQSISRTQAGTYTCTLQSPTYNTMSSTAVTVVYPPSVSVIGAQTLYIPQGLSLSLNCSFVGLPTPNITWTGPSGLTIQSSSHLMVQSSSNFTRLTINSLNGSDTGNYTCTATNYLGPSSLATAVYVQVPPDPPSNLVITNTDTYTISLSWSSGFTGYSPLVNVSISYESPNYFGLEGTMYLTLPVVYSATLSGLHPNANYSIHVALANAAGFTSSFTTTMTSTPSFSEAPLLLGNPGDTNVQGGTRLSLVCVAWGNPLPNITWSTNPLGVPYQNIYTTIISLNSLAYQVSILEICYALPEFSGTYSCSSSNGVVSSPLGGNTASFQLQVTVPSCSGSYNITSSLQSFFTPDEVVCFTCSLPGGIPVRSWTINGTSAVGLPGVTVLYNGTLLVADPLGLLLSPTNSLPIQCFDQTQSFTYTTYISITGPPDPPSNLVVTNRNTTSLSLNWSSGFNGNSPLVFVNINYESSNYPSNGTQYLLLPLAYSALLTVLHPNANYSIHVALVNAAGFTSSFTTIVTSTLPLTISVPQSVQIQENSDLQALCSVVGDISGIMASITWKNSQGITVSNNSFLFIPKIQRSQSGTYTCYFQSSVYNTAAFSTISVLYPPSVSVAGAQTIYIPQGLSLTLNCSFVGLPTPNITWTGPSGLTIQSSSHLMVQSSSNFTRLTINSLNGSDTGNYTCTATNYLGPSSLATVVYVQVPPDPPFNLVITNTDTYTISLSWSSGFTGYSPLVNVSISYESPNYLGLEGTMYLTLPVVYSATLSGLHPNANYSIHVALVNAAGFTSSFTTIVTSTLPLTISVPQSVQIQENSDLQALCSVVGDISGIMASITWKNSQGITVSNNSFLFIPKIQRSQSGTYTCYFQSSVYNTAAFSTISVLYPPSVSVAGAQTIYIPQGLSLTLNCSFVGLPTPNITWTGPSGLTIQSSSHLMVQSSSNFTRLTINSLNGSDTGNYTCTATNYLGPSSLATVVYVQVPPDPPFNLVITNTDTYTISLSWSSGFTGYSPLVNVSISYESPNYLGLEGTMYLTLPVVYSATLSGLHPNANYSIHVALVNAAGFTSSFTTIQTSTPSFSEAPLLLSNPGDTAVQGGTRLSLVCVAWGNPLPNITWSTNPLGVPYQNIYTTIISLNSLTYQVSILEICYALPEFSGTYSCSSSNGVVSSPLGGNTASFQLQVTVPSCSGSYNITTNLQSFFTPEVVVCFTCSLPGGVPVRSWTINGTSAVGLPGVTVLYNGTLLVADPLGLLLSPTNSLPIQCFDQTQSVTYAAYLGFGATPDPPTNVTVTNRSPISISLTWSTGFNGYAPLVYVNITYESPNYLQEGTQYLIVPPLSTATLSGLHPNANYSIHVALVNAAGFTSSFATIQSSTLSVGLVVPQSIQLQENSNLLLLCIVAGNTSGINAYIQWLDPQGRVVSNNGSLMVQSISRTQAGTYTCTLQSPTYNTMSSTTVTVFYPPTVSVIGAQTIYIPQGLSLSLNCSFVGLPIPNITWTSPSGLTIQSSSHLMVQSSSNFTQLTINSLNGSDTGNYTCIATNYLGPSSLATAVYVQVPPDPPSNLVITSTDTYTTSLSWSSGFTGYSPLVNVSISYESPNYLGLEGTMYLTLPVVYSATLSGLHPNANYSIHVALVNAAGFTSSFATIMTSTPSLRLLAPIITSLYANSSIQLVVMWTITTNATMAPADSWILQYTPFGGNQMNLTIQGSLQTFTLTGLSKGTSYSVRLAGVNVAGLGPFSPYVVNATAVDAPSAPLNLSTTTANTTSILVRWTLPLDNGGRIIQYYRIQYRMVGGYNLTLVDQVVDLEYTITGLPYDSIYEVQILAFNGVFFSIPTPFVQQKIQPIGVLPPDPPSNLSVINQDMTSIGLSWNTGFNGNSPLVNVSISYESSNYPSDGTQYILLPLVYSATLSGLHPNANYSIHAALLNAAGFTSSPATINSSTLSLTIAAPSIIALYAVSSIQLAIRWMVTVDATMAPVDSWILQYTPFGGNQMNLTIQGSLRTFTLTGLSKGTSYSVRLAGVNVAGLGPFSPYVVNTTAVDAPSAPLNQSAFPINATSIGLSWAPPIDNGGRSIQYYAVEIRLLGGGGMFTLVHQVTGLMDIVTGLQDGMTFEVQVAASNGVLLGTLSLSVVTTPSIGPPVPLGEKPQVSSRTDTTAVVNWLSPGGYIDNYTLQYKLSGQTWNEATTYIIAASATMFTMTGLTPNTSYDVQLRTNNKNGSSIFVSQPFITEAQPTVMVVGPPSSVPVGSTVVLVCEVVSGYNSSVSWSRSDGSALPPGASVHGYLLLLTNVQQSGSYVCTFAGSAGPISEEFSLNVSDIAPVPTSSQLPLPSAAPPSTLLPEHLIIVASLSAGIPLFCIGLVSATVFILLCQRYFRIKRQYTVNNPLYNTVSLPNTHSLDEKGAATVESPYAINSEDFGEYTSVF